METKITITENYHGVKFRHIKEDASYPIVDQLQGLNRWAWIFSQLGLAPLHPSGAYGNFSYRKTDNKFYISKSGMIPEENFNAENFSLVTDFNNETMILRFQGENNPSSESPMHALIYKERPEIRAILHGHNDIMTNCCHDLRIPCTPVFHDYGTIQLAEAGCDLAKSEDFFILKKHGFVALGKSIEDAAQRSLTELNRLINYLKPQK